MKFYQLTEPPGVAEMLLSGLSPMVFEEALRTGSLGSLLFHNHQLFIKIRFKKHGKGHLIFKDRFYRT